MHLFEKEVVIPVKDGVISGTLTLPFQTNARPCLLLISGSGANDRDETVCGHTPFRTIAQYFAEYGYTVFRFDDRGVGGSTGNANEHDFDSAVADVVFLYRWLAKHPNVDAARIVLLGHSEGGLVAASAAAQLDPWAVVMLAGPSVPIEELLHEQARSISSEFGATAAQLEHERKMNEQVFALCRSDLDRAAALSEIESVIQNSLRSWPDADSMDEGDIRDNARQMAKIVSAPAYRSLLRQSPASILDRVTCRMLAVYGEKDTQVPGVSNANAFREITAGHRHAFVRLFPSYNHLFQLATTGFISEYEVLPQCPEIEVLKDIHAWIEADLPISEPADMT